MLGKELATLPRQIKDWAESLTQSQLALREWSPEVARIAVTSEIREILRGQASGRATGDSLERVTEALQDFKDAWRPMKDWFTNQQNEFFAALLDRLRGDTEQEKEARARVQNLPEYQEMKRRHEQERATERTAQRWAPGVRLPTQESMRQEEERRFLKDYIHPGGPTYKLFEDWMRDWQDGKHLQFESRRPVPANP
jgi:hypothetical protein